MKTETSGSTPPNVSGDVKGGHNQSGSQDTPPVIPVGNEDSREAKIRELREKLTKFLADVKDENIEVKDGKDIIFVIRQWNKEKKSLFSEIKSEINKISLEPEKPKDKDMVNVTFSLSSPVSGDKGKIIEAILNQYKEDN